MAVRQVVVEFSAAPTKQQLQKFMSLILQNVTDFSGYTSDSLLASFFSGGKTLSVVAVGDNLPVTVVGEYHVGTNTASTVLQIGNLFHTVGLTTSATNCCLMSSTSSGVAYVPISTRTSVSTSAGTNGSIDTRVNLGESLKIRMCIAESYLAIAFYATSGTVGGFGYTEYRNSHMYAKFGNDLVYVNRCDAPRNIPSANPALYQLQTSFVLRAPSEVDANRPNYCTIMTNYGPLNAILPDGVNPINMLNGAAPGLSYTDWRGASIPGYILDGGLDKKPVFQFKIYDMNNGQTYDMSGVHSVLMLAYTRLTDYTDDVTNGGMNYMAVGSFLFAS